MILIHQPEQFANLGMIFAYNSARKTCIEQLRVVEVTGPWNRQELTSVHLNADVEAAFTQQDVWYIQKLLNFLTHSNLPTNVVSPTKKSLPIMKWTVIKPLKTCHFPYLQIIRQPCFPFACHMFHRFFHHSSLFHHPHTLTWHKTHAEGDQGDQSGNHKPEAWNHQRYCALICCSNFLGIWFLSLGMWM